ncbi:hypothetical protein R3P38DRAFT_2864772 [Favolaschia claudopus]|uniref:C2H2-type domain-containing protein n=1 Tax=Favolaschia claudopus TaxID=2862362 RepID=A0AAW0DID3_9AGAR
MCCNDTTLHTKGRQLALSITSPPGACITLQLKFSTCSAHCNATKQTLGSAPTPVQVQKTPGSGPCVTLEDCTPVPSSHRSTLIDLARNYNLAIDEIYFLQTVGQSPGERQFLPPHQTAYSEPLSSPVTISRSVSPSNSISAPMSDADWEDDTLGLMPAEPEIKEEEIDQLMESMDSSSSSSCSNIMHPPPSDVALRQSEKETAQASTFQQRQEPTIGNIPSGRNRVETPGASRITIATVISDAAPQGCEPEKEELSYAPYSRRRRVRCPNTTQGCDLTFTRRADALRHVEGGHCKYGTLTRADCIKLLSKLQCPVCGNVLSRADALRRHRDNGCVGYWIQGS